MTDDDSNDEEIKPNNLEESKVVEELPSSDYQRQMAEALRQKKDPTPPIDLKTGPRKRKLMSTKIVHNFNSPKASPNIYSESILKSAGFSQRDAGRGQRIASSSGKKSQLTENQHLTDIGHQGDSFSPLAGRMAHHDEHITLPEEHKSRATVLENSLYTTGEDLSLSNVESSTYKAAKIPGSCNSHPSEHQFLLDS